ELSADGQALLVAHTDGVTTVPLPAGGTVDIYLPAPTEGTGFIVAPAPANAELDRTIRARCGFHPGQKAVSVEGSIAEAAALKRLIEAIPGEAGLAAGRLKDRLWPKYAVRVRDHVRGAVGVMEWLRYLLAGARQAGHPVPPHHVQTALVHVNDVPLLLTYHSRLIGAPHRVMAAAAFGDLAIRSGSGSGIVIVAPRPAVCGELRGGLPANVAQTCVARKGMPEETALFALIPGPGADAAMLDGRAAMLDGVMPSLEQLFAALGNGGTLPRITYRTGRVNRIFYGSCRELTRGKTTLGPKGWSLPEEGLHVFPTSQPLTYAISRRPAEGAILLLPSESPVDLYLTPALRFHPNTDLYPHRSTAEQTGLAARMEREQHCELPLTIAEQHAIDRARDFPPLALDLAFRMAWTSMPPPSSASSSDSFATVRGALDCDPAQKHFNCAELASATGMIPHFAPGSAKRPDLLGANLSIEADLLQLQHLQIAVGGEINYSEILKRNDIDLRRFFDLNARISFRQNILRLGRLIFLYGVSVGLGPAIGIGHEPDGTLWAAGGFTTFVEIPAIRGDFAGSYTWALVARAEHNFFGLRETTFANRGTNFALDSFTALLRVGFIMGEPRMRPLPEPEELIVLGGELLLTPSLEFAPNEPSEARLDEALAMTNPRGIFRLPIFRSPMHRHAEQVEDAFRLIAERIRALDEGYRVQIICAVDDTGIGDSAAETRERATRGARLAKHLLTTMGIAPQRLIVTSWTADQFRRGTAQFNSDHLARFVGTDGLLLFSVLKPLEE
ncbi:MAG: hypothetical protein HY543_12505, partial [Deltaproteobacteria bacterium]|nr:hypothetical protein [Deltaproteobacteria bacterium]